jgi:hypothetical protein
MSTGRKLIVIVLGAVHCVAVVVRYIERRCRHLDLL